MHGMWHNMHCMENRPKSSCMRSEESQRTVQVANVSCSRVGIQPESGSRAFFFFDPCLDPDSGWIPTRVRVNPRYPRVRIQPDSGSSCTVLQYSSFGKLQVCRQPEPCSVRCAAAAGGWRRRRRRRRQQCDARCMHGQPGACQAAGQVACNVAPLV